MTSVRGSRLPVDVLAPRLAQFLAVAEFENVSRAAEQLGIGQPALSRAIVRLEADLGLTLLVRRGRAVRLTPAGRQLRERLAPLLDRMNAEVQGLLDAATPGRGQVRIGFLKSMVDEIAPTMLAGFHQAYPGIRVAMTTGSSEELGTALLYGELDLALVAPKPTMPGIEAVVLDAQPLVVEVPRWHRLAGAGEITWAELAEESFVAMSAGYGTRLIFDMLCADAGFAPSVVSEADDTRTVRALVASGTGIALLPPAGTPHPDIVSLEVKGQYAVREFCLSWRATASHGPSVLTLKEFLQQQRGRLLG